MNARRCAVGLFCVSGALLGYELLLMRLLSLSLWGHFAGFVISIAMLGLAASGLYLHFHRERIAASADRLFAISAGLFALTAPAAFGLAQCVPFTPFLLAWTPREYLHLALRVALFFIPFFVGGVAMGIPFVARVLPPAKLYCWTMLGSSAPIPLLILGMGMVHPQKLLVPVALLALPAVLLSGQRGFAKAAWTLAAAAGAATVGALPFRFSEYKDLPRTLTLPGAQIIEERYGPNGMTQTVRSRFTRYLPGLSLNFAGELPRSELVFVDGSAMEVVFDLKASRRQPEFLRMSPEAFSYELRERPRVLSLYGGPVEILRGIILGAESLVAVDDLAIRADALDRVWRRFGESPFQYANVRRIDDDARHYLSATRDTFDVMVLSLLGSHGSSTAGAASLDASCLFTLEGISLALDHLAPGGHAAFSAWVENPPRTGVRLAALIVEALHRRGITHPASHILGLRSWSTLTLFVGRESFDGNAVARLKEFAAKKSFDLVWCPGLSAEDANQWNRIADEPYFRALHAFLEGDPQAFRQTWPFRLDSPTYDRPFFNHHFRWKAVPDFLARMGMDWIPFIEWGYLLRVASLLVATGLGVLLLIGPCAATRARPSLRSAVLFFSLGVAYMAVEIRAIYQALLLLSWPTAATALVLTAMLAASGAGAAVLARGTNATISRHAAMGMIVVMLLLSLMEFPLLSSLTFPHSLAYRVIVTAWWISVPAFFLGYPFPHALGQLQRPEEIPWALALNGFGSVLGSLGATLVAVEFGLTALALLGVGLYLLVAILLKEDMPEDKERTGSESGKGSACVRPARAPAEGKPNLEP